MVSERNAGGGSVSRRRALQGAFGVGVASATWAQPSVRSLVGTPAYGAVASGQTVGLETWEAPAGGNYFGFPVTSGFGRVTIPAQTGPASTITIDVLIEFVAPMVPGLPPALAVEVTIGGETVADNLDLLIVGMFRYGGQLNVPCSAAPPVPYGPPSIFVPTGVTFGTFVGP